MSTLPEDFEGFVTGTVRIQCDRCGEVVRERWLADGTCVGCRYGGDT